MSWRQRFKGALIGAYLDPRTQAATRRARTLMRSKRKAQLFFQACDPYSYLLSQLLPSVRDRYALDIEVIPIGPPPSDVDTEPQLRRDFAIRDAIDLAHFYELDFPAAATQPDEALVRRANAIVIAARGDRLAAAAAVGAALWSGDAAALDAAADRFGTTDESRVESALQVGNAQQRKRGHYLGAMVLYRGEWFWGVDRLGYLERRLGGPDAASALRRRPAPDPIATAGSAPGGGVVELEMYHSFRSPYSYLALARTFALAERYPVRLTVKPVLPMVMRGHVVPLVKRLYIVKDAKREADRHGIPFGRICDPVGTGVERCFAIVPYAEHEQRLSQFLLSVGRAVWSEALDMADDRDLRTVVERVGLDWETARARLNDDGWRERAEQNREDLYSLGLWGVPCFRLGSYSTWGQDRLPLLEQRIRAACGQ